MSSLTFTEIEQAAMKMGTYYNLVTHYVPKTAEAESNKFEAMPAQPPRISRVETLLANVVNLKNLAITWIKETLPQKLAMWKFHAAEKNALKALHKAIANQNLDEKIEKFKEFLAFDMQLMDMSKKDSCLQVEIMGSYATKLSEIVAQDFNELDQLVGTLYNTCTCPYAEAKVLRELAPVHQSLCRFLHFYAEPDEHQKTVFSQFRYCEFNT